VERKLEGRKVPGVKVSLDDWGGVRVLEERKVERS